MGTIRKPDGPSGSHWESRRIGYTPTGFRADMERDTARRVRALKAYAERGYLQFPDSGLTCRCGKTAMYRWGFDGYCRDCVPQQLKPTRARRA